MKVSSSQYVLSTLFGGPVDVLADGGAPCLDQPGAYDGLAVLMKAVSEERTADKLGAAMMMCANTTPPEALRFVAGIVKENQDALLNVAIDECIKLAEIRQFSICMGKACPDFPPTYGAEKLVAAALAAGVPMIGQNRQLLEDVFSERNVLAVNRGARTLRHDKLRYPFERIGRKKTFDIQHSHDAFRALMNVLPGFGVMMSEVNVPGARFSIAGGAPLGALTDSLEKLSDIDVFIISEDLDVSTATKLVISGILHLHDAHPGCIIDVTPTVVTVNVPLLEIPYKSFAVQFVLRLYTSAAQVVLSFDLAPCRFLMERDGRLLCTRSAAWAVANHLTFADPRMVTSSYRAFKYSKKGFPYALPKDMDFLMPAADRVSYMQVDELKKELLYTTVSGVLAIARLLLLRPRKTRLEDFTAGDSAAPKSVMDSNPRRLKRWGPLFPVTATWVAELETVMRKQWYVTDPCERMSGESGAAFLC